MKGKQAEGRGIFVERFLIQLEKQDLTMREVGLLAGMHQATVRHYTSKKGDEPRMRSLVAIARALNVSTDYLCGLTDDDGQSGHRATDNIRALLQRAISTYGSMNQLFKASEEIGELLTAIGRFEASGEDWKAPEGPKMLDNIAEEVADVRIMLDQICMIYAIEDRAGQWRNHKLARLKERIDRKEGLDHREVLNDV